ncbi:hypothetical protein [uncultured Paracoccus sp.]|uniref:hypothetical protein n=1 Tax=uncultured Paracoccus sp. TaxID=189685 RepID=UPI00260C3671|nr:hypothetical protein [uncultured Paracoccus sp.]
MIYELRDQPAGRAGSGLTAVRHGKRSEIEKAVSQEPSEVGAARQPQQHRDNGPSRRLQKPLVFST